MCTCCCDFVGDGNGCDVRCTLQPPTSITPRAYQIAFRARKIRYCIISFSFHEIYLLNPINGQIKLSVRNDFSNFRQEKCFVGIGRWPMKLLTGVFDNKQTPV